MASQEFAQAAADYQSLAEAAQSRGLPQAAPLLVAAGMAAVEAGDGERGVEIILRGLEEFRRRGQIQRLRLVASRIIDDLATRGHRSAADRIDSFLHDEGIDLQTPPEPSVRTGSLPLKCPQCGGSVHPDEVEWASTRSAVCAYCGSILTAESGSA